MNTIKNNKLIADFMGLEKENGLYLFTTPMDDYKTDTLYFDTSWDWLMPVIKKIKLMGVDLETWRMITNPSDYEIENVHNQVVQFINQLNKQTKL